MDLSPGLMILRRSWLAVLLMTIVAGVVGYGASFLVDPTYSATTRLLVRAREARLLTSSGQDLSRIPGALDSAMGKPLTQTYSGLVQSRVVAEQVVREIGLDQPRPVDDSLIGRARSTLKLGYRMALAYAQYGYYAQATPYEQAVGFVQNNIEAKPIKDSYLVEIKAKADDPQLAVAVADSVTKVFMQESRERFQKGAASYSSFLKQEMENFRTQAEQGQQAVRRYKEEKGITDIGEEVRLTAATYQNAQNEIVQTRAALEDARARYSLLQQELDRLDRTEMTTTRAQGRTTLETPQTTSTVSTEESSPITTTVESPESTSVLETGRNRTTTTVPASSSTTRVGGSSTTVRTDTTVTATSSGSNTEDTQTVGPNRVYQDLLTSAIRVKAEISGLQARHDSLSDTLAGRTAASSGLTEAEAKLSELQLVASTAAEAYRRIGTMYESALLNDSWGTEEVTLVDNAAAPLYPDGPKRYLFALIGLLFGMAGGIGTAYFMDEMRRRFPLWFAPRAWPGRSQPHHAGASQLGAVVQFAGAEVEQAAGNRVQPDGQRP